MKIRFHLLILLLIINACTSDEAEIQRVISKRWEALETKNINLYSECISQEYPERENLIKKIEENFKKIDTIQIQSQVPAIYINQDTATVYQNLRLIITIRGNKQDLETREKLILKKTKKGWKITEGINP